MCREGPGFHFSLGPGEGAFFLGADIGGQSLREEPRGREKRKNEIYDLLNPSFYVMCATISNTGSS